MFLRRDPVARRGAVFVVCVLTALIGGYLIGKASVPRSSSPSVVAPPHVHNVGFTLDLASSDFPLSAVRELRFSVRGPDGAVVTRFETRHDRQMHVIVVRTDLTGYQHVHPVLDAGGEWSAPLTLGVPGTWQVYADFTTVGADGVQVDQTVSGLISVPGVFTPMPLPEPAPASVVDGVTVTLDGSVRSGGTAPLTLRVSGGPLERYLGAFGHLVVVRAGNLSFVHVHPEEELHRGGVRFWVTVPGPGTYRAFFDFSIGGAIRTAEFTLAVDNK